MFLRFPGSDGEEGTCQKLCLLLFKSHNYCYVIFEQIKGSSGFIEVVEKVKSTKDANKFSFGVKISIDVWNLSVSIAR
jgi:hypothetical protein